MARPNTTTITKHKIVEQFEQLGLKSVINLQTPGKEKKIVKFSKDFPSKYCPAYI